MMYHESDVNVMTKLINHDADDDNDNDDVDDGR